MRLKGWTDVAGVFPAEVSTGPGGWTEMPASPCRNKPPPGT